MEDRGEGVALMFGVVPENSFRLLQVVIRRSRCHPHVPIDQRLQRWQLLALMGRTTDGVVPPPYGVRASVVCPWSLGLVGGGESSTVGVLCARLQMSDSFSLTPGDGLITNRVSRCFLSGCYIHFTASS